jgi:hypothetical protein
VRIYGHYLVIDGNKTIVLNISVCRSAILQNCSAHLN